MWFLRLYHRGNNHFKIAVSLELIAMSKAFSKQFRDKSFWPIFIVVQKKSLHKWKAFFVIVHLGLLSTQE